MKILPVLALSLLALTSCGSDEASASAGSSGGKSDKGSASMQIGGQAWTATRASARQKDKRLKLEFTRSDRVGSVSQRDSTTLSLRDYSGPGTYKAGTGSQFVRVGIDTGKVVDEENAGAVALDALGDAVMLMLMEAEVIITSDEDGWVEGTYSYAPPVEPSKMIQPVEGGVFRALRKD